MNISNSKCVLQKDIWNRNVYILQVYDPLILFIMCIWHNPQQIRKINIALKSLRPSLFNNRITHITHLFDISCRRVVSFVIGFIIYFYFSRPMSSGALHQRTSECVSLPVGDTVLLGVRLYNTHTILYMYM